MEFKLEHVWCLKWLLDDYCAQAGQKINYGKSELFVSPNMRKEDVDKIVSILVFVVLPSLEFILVVTWIFRAVRVAWLQGL